MKLWKAAKRFGSSCANVIKGAVTAVIVVVSFAVQTVQAAVPADVTTAFTELLTDGATFMTSVWGVLVIFVVGFMWMKLFRKGLNKGT